MLDCPSLKKNKRQQGQVREQKANTAYVDDEEEVETMALLATTGESKVIGETFDSKCEEVAGKKSCQHEKKSSWIVDSGDIPYGKLERKTHGRALEER